MEKVAQSQPKITQEPWLHGDAAEVRHKIGRWVRSLTDKEFELLELLAAEIREREVDRIMSMLESSEIGRLVSPKPRKSFRLLDVPSFRLA